MRINGTKIKYILEKKMQMFAHLILVFRFIEHGEYKENQYGTSIEAIRSVQAKNKMCIVDVQPEVYASCYSCSYNRNRPWNKLF